MYSNAFGIRQNTKSEGGVIVIFLERLLKRQSPTIFGDGNATRNFIYIEDVIDANMNALYSGSNEVFNIGTGKATSIKELFYLMKEIMDVNIEVEYSNERDEDIRHSYFSIDKAKEKLKWIPKYTLEEGLYKTMNYYKELLTKEVTMKLPYV
jgi:UDP-glucose 4-epimerase